jgi:5-hydroxyisourate hydrolase
VTSISTHVLDSASGLPAAGMTVRLEASVLVDGTFDWTQLGSAVTDVDGRIKSWGDDAPIGSGSMRLIFDTGAWFQQRDRECFYPEVIITFAVNGDDSHSHVPLLLAAYAYSTYRGS